MAEDDVTRLPAGTEPIPGLKGLDEAAGKALTPAAEEFGQEIVPLGKRTGQLTNRVGVLLVRALEPLVYGLEKSADYIEKAVSDRLKDVPPEKVVPPNLRIAAPAMQALTYSMDDEPIREMFANLLAADMNADQKKDAHPAFVELIKEMTPVDARVLKVCEHPRCAFIVRIGTVARFFTLGTHYSFDVDGLSPEDIGTSLNNLERLGLLERRDEFPVSADPDKIEGDLRAKYEETRKRYDTPPIKEHLGISKDQKVAIHFRRHGLYLNPLGVSFARICLK